MCLIQLNFLKSIGLVQFFFLIKKYLSSWVIFFLISMYISFLFAIVTTTDLAA